MLLSQTFMILSSRGAFCKHYWNIVWMPPWPCRNVIKKSAMSHTPWVWRKAQKLFTPSSKLQENLRGGKAEDLLESNYAFLLQTPTVIQFRKFCTDVVLKKMTLSNFCRKKLHFFFPTNENQTIIIFGFVSHETKTVKCMLNRA